MKVLVTGIGGFIGSHLAEVLLGMGHDVVAIDSFDDFYDPNQKRQNLRSVLLHGSVDVLEGDLSNLPQPALVEILEDVEVVFHQAARAGVRTSWLDAFQQYVDSNILATQRLLEVCRIMGVRRFVYASSSSVYGRALRYPTRESDVCKPHSPYGVSKLAGENLVSLYGANFGLPTIALRYHTVYGPRQRPDMAIHRMFESVLYGKPFPLYAKMDFVREFTFVEDIVSANVNAALLTSLEPGTIMNVAGGSETDILRLIQAVESVSGKELILDHKGPVPGDVERTGGDSTLARDILQWKPAVTLEDGLSAQFDWHKSAERIR